MLRWAPHLAEFVVRKWRHQPPKPARTGPAARRRRKEEQSVGNAL